MKKSFLAFLDRIAEDRLKRIERLDRSVDEHPFIYIIGISMILLLVLSFGLGFIISKEYPKVDINNPSSIPMTSIDRLVVDSNTGIVYIQVPARYGAGMTPYLGEHGCPCRYVDGKIIELYEEKEE